MSRKSRLRLFWSKPIITLGEPTVYLTLLLDGEKEQFTDNTCETEQNKSYACVVTLSVFAWEKLILCFQV